MKKMEYSFVQEAGDLQHDLESSKHDDYMLPEFTKEVPVSSKKHESKDSIGVDYEWKKTESEIVRVKRIDFRKGEELADLYRIAARDGADSVAFKHNNTVYIMRKTVREIAMSLFNAYGKISGALESIVGYLRTVIGNDYVISKVERESWTFDKRIAKNGIHFVEPDTLNQKSRSRLIELITEKISDLHGNNAIMGRFTLNNVLLVDNDLKFTDLRRLRVSRRKSFVIEEFKALLQYLFSIGLASRDDVYVSIAYYTAHNEQSCNDWFYEKTNKKAGDTLDIVSRIESEVYG